MWYTKNVVKKLLHLEGLAVFVAALYFYYYTNGNWWFFAVLILFPDVSMIGYLINKKLGAMTYNLVHNYLLAMALIFISLISQNIIFIHLGLILAAHVGMDRMLGFGLKYPYKFKETHMQKV